MTLSFAFALRLSRALRPAAALLLCAAAPAAAQHPHPDSIRVVTSDVPLFFAAHDALASSETLRDSVEVIRTRYLEAGSQGLRDFSAARIGGPEGLVGALREYPAYYAHLPASLAELERAEPEIRDAFRRFEAMYPDAVFADVFLAVGAANSGGTTSAERILIGAEMYGRDDAAPVHELDDWRRTVLRGPSRIPHVAVHELMHVNQPPVARNLLGMVLREGAADFLTALVMGESLNPHLEAWAAPRERELWAEFQGVMGGQERAGWLFGGGSGGERPADLGYWLGARIVKSFYDRAADKRQAIGQILTAATDAEGFLRRSGYADDVAARASAGRTGFLRVCQETAVEGLEVAPAPFRVQGRRGTEPVTVQVPAARAGTRGCAEAVRVPAGAVRVTRAAGGGAAVQGWGVSVGGRLRAPTDSRRGFATVWIEPGDADAALVLTAGLRRG